MFAETSEYRTDMRRGLGRSSDTRPHPGSLLQRLRTYGDPIDATRAGRIAWAFRPPLCFAQVHTTGFYDDAGFCQDCDAPYCYQHWHGSESESGCCPRGHGKSLDPHWSPLAVDH
jgi:hypothetical protein